ncbi:hypothetical protein K439DRAFT_1080534 [Ramaria rubella]|nr:hypothetical protein K439DRAFT_1080534 [Ramaria rubella]
MDPSWCPGCDRLILPKRYIVPVNNSHPVVPSSDSDSLLSSDREHDPNHPPPPPTPTPVPSSPEVRKKPLNDALAHRAAAVRRAHAYGGGLVHGTGRVRPGGGLKPRPAAAEQPKKANLSPPKPAPRHQNQDTQVIMGNPTAAQIDSYFHPSIVQSAVATGKKTRVVISQEPTPLYCSDECRARDLKNSFLESESAGFAGAPAAIHRVAQLELVQESVEQSMKSRRASSSSESLVEPLHPLFRTGSLSSASSTSTASSSRLHVSESRRSTIRASVPKSRPHLPPRSSSFSTWGSPSKAALAPPTLYNVNASTCSLGSSVCSTSVGSALFDDDAVISADKDGEETCGTTPSRRGSDSSAESKQKKRVSFASDSKPSTLVEPARIARAAAMEAREDWRVRRQRNTNIDANPLRAGMREEDQPQARRMKQMAYDGMPGPAELRGLTYKFDRFLYPLIPPKATIVEKMVRRWDDSRQEWIEEIKREEVFEERKKLFNFLED